MKVFNKIGLFTMPEYTPKSVEVLNTLAQLLTQSGYEVIIHRFAQESCELKLPTARLRDMCAMVDVVISIGGDGTLLRAARRLSKTETPVIGVNRGTLGFLTDISPKQFETQLLPILKGEYEISERFLIQGKVCHQNECFETNNALNDITLFPGNAAQLIEFSLFINDRFVYRQRSDGMIISTPTGSTAYALSAGGPILQPDLNAMLLVPKAPHSLSCRPLVISANNTIRLQVNGYKGAKPGVSFDGHHNIELDLEDELIITQQEKPLQLLQPKGKDYFYALRSKLHWSTQPTNTE